MAAELRGDDVSAQRCHIRRQQRESAIMTMTRQAGLHGGHAIAAGRLALKNCGFDSEALSFFCRWCRMRIMNGIGDHTISAVVMAASRRAMK